MMKDAQHRTREGNAENGRGKCVSAEPGRRSVTVTEGVAAATALHLLCFCSRVQCVLSGEMMCVSVQCR